MLTWNQGRSSYPYSMRPYGQIFDQVWSDPNASPNPNVAPNYFKFNAKCQQI